QKSLYGFGWILPVSGSKREHVVTARAVRHPPDAAGSVVHQRWRNGLRPPEASWCDGQHHAREWGTMASSKGRRPEISVSHSERLNPHAGCFVPSFPPVIRSSRYGPGPASRARFVAYHPARNGGTRRSGH